MARITYVAFDGTEYVADVAAGSSVMQGAVNNDIPGIDAECGGACACATCRVGLDDDWYARVGPPSENEADMLEFAGDGIVNTRLSCQIPVSDALDGLVVHMPESQK